MIYIITTNYRMAQNLCYELQVSPRDRSKVRIITREENCQGIQLTNADTHHFLALPEDWSKQSTFDLRRAWQYVIKTSEARSAETTHETK